MHAPYTHIVVFWHVNNIPPMISYSQICCNAPPPPVLYGSNICEIFLYNRQLVAITHQLIYGVWAAHHWGGGGNFVKQDYYYLVSYIDLDGQGVFRYLYIYRYGNLYKKIF